MATSTVPGHHEAVRKNSAELLHRISMNSCPPSSFPDKFQDFFTALNEDTDDLPSMLEDKLIPRYVCGVNSLVSFLFTSGNFDLVF